MTEVNSMSVSGVRIQAVWDPDAKVYLGTSEDLPGLIIEAKSLPDVMEEASLVINDLIESNDGVEIIDNSIDLDLTVEPMRMKVAVTG